MLFSNDVKPYQCSNCQKWWKPKLPFVSCAIFHQGNGCCHYGEDEVPPCES